MLLDRGASPLERFEIHEAAEQDDLVVFHAIMSGRHTGDFATYQPGTSTVDTVMPPTGKAFAITQTHWFGTRDGLITEHWANRDDLAMAKQAGWVPPHRHSCCARHSPNGVPRSAQPDTGRSATLPYLLRGTAGRGTATA